MHDDLEQRLIRLTPRGVRTEVRPRVLAAVSSRLTTASSSHRLRWAAWTTAALILFGVVLNVMVCQAADRRLARLVGPPTPTNRNADRSLAEYNAVLQQLLAELQSPISKSHFIAPTQRSTKEPRDDCSYWRDDGPSIGTVVV